MGFFVVSKIYRKSLNQLIDHMPNNTDPVSRVIHDFIDTIQMARSENTAKTYRNGLRAFCQVLEERNLPPHTTSIATINEDSIIWFTSALKNYAPATERLYLTAVTRFFEYVVAENLSDVNLPRLRLLIKQRSRLPGQRLPQFPRDAIEQLLNYVQDLVRQPVKSEKDQLRNYRDRAFLLVLADTGLRVHEACGLRRGDIDWNEGKAMIIGKGNQQALVRFSIRALAAIKDYINLRAGQDGNSGKALTSLPLFSRHDRGAGSKTKPITTTTGRNIVAQRAKEHLGDKYVGSITPHSFRHYFVTTILFGSGGNLKLAQKLARHKNIAVTQRYAHLADEELDRSYYEIFNDQ
jgi:site-specific recombinase XerD